MDLWLYNCNYSFLTTLLSKLEESHVFVQDRFLFSDIGKKLFRPNRSFLSGCPDLWILLLGYPAWQKASVPSQSLITAEMKRWLPTPTSRERTWGSRVLASWVNPTPWHYQRAGKQNYISSDHVLKRSGGCHSYLCTTSIYFVYAGLHLFKKISVGTSRGSRQRKVFGSRPHWSIN